MTKRQTNQLRRWTLHMQAVLLTRRAAHACLPPLVAGLMDVRLRMAGLWIVDEMRRLEGTEGRGAA